MKGERLISQNLALAPRTSAVLKSAGRIHIPDFLTAECATALHHALQNLDWKITLNGAKDSYDLSAADIGALDLERKQAILDVAHTQARSGFQFLFDTYRISDEVERGALTEGLLADFFAWWNGEAGLGLMRAITGDPAIVYADAQATRYRPGHFLTAHDDDVAGKNRLFAYVFNLTPRWRADWGGLLMFHDGDGHVAEAYTPRFGALNIFRVPQQHSVSYVASLADAARYSITGWLRSRRPAPGEG